MDGLNNSNRIQTGINNKSNADNSGKTKTPPVYVVKKGDTLSQISEKIGKSQSEILRNNPQVKNPNQIYVGDKLNLVSPNQNSGVYTVKSGDTLSEIAQNNQTTVGDLLRANPKAANPRNLIFPGQKLRLPAATINPNVETVRPKPIQPKPIIKPTIPIKPKSPTVQSPIQTKPNTQPTPIKVQAPQVIQQTTPIKGDLKLGVNEKYRADLLFAQQRTGTNASSLAGLINAEAAKDRSGQWNANSFNSTTNAAGLTQFLRGTWRGMATQKGTYLNQIATEKGYVKDGKIVNDKALLDLRYDSRASIVSAAEYDKNTLAGAEKLGLIPANLTGDQKAKYLYLAHHEGPGGVLTHLVDSKTATETQAKQILGIRLGGAAKAENYMKSFGSYRAAYANFAENKAKNIFPQQFGNDKSKMQEYVKKFGSYESGYRAWLNDYTNDKVQPGKFRSAQTEQTTVPTKPTVIPKPVSQPVTTQTTNVQGTGLPDTSKMSESEKYDLYSNYFKQKGVTVDTRPDQRSILGLRVTTNSKLNNNRGAYDDRMVVLWTDKSGQKHVGEFTANTEPNYRYVVEGRAKNVGGSNAGELAKIPDGNYDFHKSTSQRLGNQVLREQDNRISSTYDTNQDGNYDKSDTIATADGILFHKGGRVDVGSMGCQTMPPEVYSKFWDSLGNDSRFNYLLVTVK